VASRAPRIQRHTTAARVYEVGATAEEIHRVFLYVAPGEAQENVIGRRDVAVHAAGVLLLSVRRSSAVEEVVETSARTARVRWNVEIADMSGHGAMRCAGMMLFGNGLRMYYPRASRIGLDGERILDRDAGEIAGKLCRRRDAGQLSQAAASRRHVVKILECSESLGFL